jgi:hypothetical protein
MVLIFGIKESMKPMYYELSIGQKTLKLPKTLGTEIMQLQSTCGSNAISMFFHWKREQVQSYFKNYCWMFSKDF